MKFKKAAAVIMSVMMMTTAIAVPTTASAAVTNQYADQAAELDKYAYTGDDLGANYTPEATTFKVWSPTADTVRLLHYSNGSRAESTEKGVTDRIGTYNMNYDEATGIWSYTIEGDIKNTYYLPNMPVN